MIETARIRLQPHTPAGLLALMESAERFEEVTGLALADGLRGFLVSDEVPAAYVAALRTAPSANPWVHGFAVVHRASAQAIGTSAFKGEPDADGAAEIAYGIVPEFENQGYATEAAAALVRFASKDPRVRLLLAHTLPEANASTRVLTKCGFTFVGEVVDPEDGPVWRWERGPDR
jgi:[ribosomal protein S5]-alanine N-acetyltransferase